MRTGYLISLSGYHLLQKHKPVVPKAKKVKTAKKSKTVSDTDEFHQSFQQGKIILKAQSSSGRSIKAGVPWSPSKPGPSAFNVEDSPTYSESSDDEDSEPCCVCNQHSPPALRNFTTLKIVNWAKCSTRSCGHWVHLQVCHKKITVRRNEKLYCPCCSNTQSEQ